MRVPAALAQPAPDEPPAPEPPPPAAPEQKPPAVVAFEEGRALLEAKKATEACAKFEESIRLDPDAPGTMLNLGMCNAELDRIATSLRWFRKALARAAEIHLDPVYENAARDQSMALASKVPTLTVQVARGATVTLDGAPVAELDLARIEVDAGVHTVAMTMPGQRPRHEQLTIHDGEHRTVALLPPVIVDPGVAMRRRAYAIGAAGLGVWALDVGLLFYARHRSDQADHPEDLNTWKNVARYGGTSLFLAGGAAIGYAAYLYTTAPGKQERAVVPVVGPDGVGVAALGSF